MKLVHVIPYYPPHRGGMEVAAQSIVQSLTARGHTVTVITGAIGAPAGTTVEDGATVIRLRATIVANTPIIHGLRAALNGIAADSIVHIHVAQAYTPEIVAMVCTKRGIPFVAQLHLDVGPTSKAGMLLPLYKRTFLRSVLQRAARVLVLNDTFVTFVRDNYGIESPVVVPNGVDERFFLKRHDKMHTPARILSVARVSVQKRPQLLIEAMALLRTPAHLDIVGSGDREALARERINSLGLTNVTLHGDRTREEVLAFFATADVFALASEREGLPLVLIEGMAAGTPIIASDVIGNHEFVEGVGILVNPCTPQAFADAIDSVLTDPKRFEALRAAGQQKALGFRWDAVTRQLETIYRAAAGQNPSTAEVPAVSTRRKPKPKAPTGAKQRARIPRTDRKTRTTKSRGRRA